MSDSLRRHGLQPTRLLCPWNFPGKNYCSGLPFPAPRDLPDPGMEPGSFSSPVLAGRFFTTVPPERKKKVKSHSCVRLFATPWTAAHQAPLSMEFSRQEYWNGLPSPSPGDRPHPGVEPRSPALQADVLPSEPPGKSRLIAPGKGEYNNQLYRKKTEPSRERKGPACRAARSHPRVTHT